jgi:hypothetical protein
VPLTSTARRTPPNKPPIGARSKKARRRLATTRPLMPGELDSRGHFQAERIAGVAVCCNQCGGRLVLAGRNLYDDGAVWWFDYATAGGTVYTSGPEEDPESCWSFDCGQCGALDLRLSSSRIADATSKVLARCRLAGDTPRTETMRI